VNAMARHLTGHFRLFFIALLGLGLSACAYKITPPNVPPCSTGYHRFVESMVYHLNGEIGVLGDQQIITVPVDQLFVGRSENLTERGEAFLNALAPAMKCRGRWNVSVKISTNTFENRRASLVLGQQQGSVVLKKLWQGGGLNVAASRASVRVNTCYHDCHAQNLLEIVTSA